MSDYNNILSDEEIHGLFKQRLLDHPVDDALNQKLIEMETQIAFSNNVLLMPDLKKEKEMLQKLSAKTGFGPWGKWLFTGLSAVAVVATAFLLYTHKSANNNKLEIASVSQAPVFAEKPENTMAANQVTPSYKSDLKTQTQNNPAPVFHESGIPLADSLAHEAPVENKNEPQPISYFTGAYGVEKKFSLQAGDDGKIAVDTLFKGIKRVEIEGLYCDVNLTTHAENNVSIKGEMNFKFKGVILKKPDYIFHCTQKDSVLLVKLETTQKSSVFIGGSINHEGLLNFVMPKQTTLVVRNASGKLTATGLEGSSCHLGNSYGNIVATNIKSKLEVRSSSGDVVLSQVTGSVNCKASYGNINIKGVTGNMLISSSSGNISLSEVKGNAGIACSYGNIDLDKIDGELNLSSASGNITGAGLNANKINIKSSYGFVKISNARATLIVTSSSGNISLGHITGGITVSASYGEIKLSDVTGDAVLTSASGNIEISKLTGKMFITSNYGDIVANDCLSQVYIKSTSGNVRGKNIELVKDLYVNANYGHIHMNLKNDLNELTFNLSSTSGNLSLNKGGVKLTGKEGKLSLQKGDILVKGVSNSGDQVFD
ncbi:MAG: DUF4097 family beta strand repeat-containing protein [Bacteroidota bacterium]